MSDSWTSALGDFGVAFGHAREQARRTQPEWMLERLAFYACHRHAADSDAVIDQLEATLACVVPPVLRQLWCGHGAFSLLGPEVWGSLGLHPATELLAKRQRMPTWPSVYDGLCTFANRREFELGLDAQRKAVLQSQLYFFGAIAHNDSDFDLLVFDRDGRLGLVRYEHDWWHFNGEAWRNEFHGLAAGQLREIDLEQLIAERVELARDKLARWNE